MTPVTFRLVGSDPDFVHLTTRSESRPDVEHNLGVCKRTGALFCTCEDAQCRRKVGDLLDPKAEACKHVVGFHKALEALTCGA